MQFTVESVPNPYKVDLSVFPNLTEDDVQNLTMALSSIGVNSEADGLILYPSKSPSTKVKQLIYFFVAGALQEDLGDWDVFGEAYTAISTAKRKPKTESQTVTSEDVGVIEDVVGSAIEAADDDDFEDDFEDEEAEIVEAPAPTTPAKAKASAKKAAAKKKKTTK